MELYSLPVIESNYYDWYLISLRTVSPVTLDVPLNVPYVEYTVIKRYYLVNLPYYDLIIYVY